MAAWATLPPCSATPGNRRYLYIKLIDLRSRMYSPATGRFLTKDFWQGDYNRPASLNGWDYVYGNPVMYSDPSGHDPYWCEKDPNPSQCYQKWLKNYQGTTSLFHESLLIVACGDGTGHNCEAGTPQYSDHNGVKQVPMYLVSNEFAGNGGKVIPMDHDAYGNTDNYAQAIRSTIEANPSMSIYLIGHSAGADAIIAALAYYQYSGNGLSRIRGVALLDSVFIYRKWREGWKSSGLYKSTQFR